MKSGGWRVKKFPHDSPKSKGGNPALSILLNTLSRGRERVLRAHSEKFFSAKIHRMHRKVAITHWLTDTSLSVYCSKNVPKIRRISPKKRLRYLHFRLFFVAEREQTRCKASRVKNRQLGGVTRVSQARRGQDGTQTRAGRNLVAGRMEVSRGQDGTWSRAGWRFVVGSMTPRPTGTLA